MAKNHDWKRPCILECLLNDSRKAQKLLDVLKVLQLRIQVYTNNSWFDIVKD